MSKYHSSPDIDPGSKRIQKEEEKKTRKSRKSFTPKKDQNHDQKSEEITP